MGNTDPTRVIVSNPQKSTSFRLTDAFLGKIGDRSGYRWHNADLGQHPDYEAASCVWGSEADRLSILCDRKAIRLTPNLAAALIRFKNSFNSSTVLVDSTCIDARSIAEGKHQLALLSQIYRQTSHVLIWLGMEELKSEAVECIILLYNQVAPRMNEVRHYEEKARPRSCQEPNTNRKVRRPPADSGMNKFLNESFRSV